MVICWDSVLVLMADSHILWKTPWWSKCFITDSWPALSLDWPTPDNGGSIMITSLWVPNVSNVVGYRGVNSATQTMMAWYEVTTWNVVEIWQPQSKLYTVCLGSDIRTAILLKVGFTSQNLHRVVSYGKFIFILKGFTINRVVWHNMVIVISSIYGYRYLYRYIFNNCENY